MYSLLTYFGLLVLGSEAFVIISLVWVIGALLGNVLTFAAVTRLRQFANCPPKASHMRRRLYKGSTQEVKSLFNSFHQQAAA